MNDRRSTNVEAMLDTQQRSIDHMAEQLERLPQLSSDVNLLISKMDDAYKVFGKIEGIGNNTIRHGTTLKLLGGIVVLLLPLLISWNVYLGQRVENLALATAVLQIQFDNLRGSHETDNTKKNP